MDAHPADALPLKILTLAEAAHLLRVSEEAVRQAAAAGDMPGRLLGGEWRFDEIAVMRWMRPSPRNSSQAEWIAARPVEIWDEAAQRELDEELAELAAIRKSWNQPVNPDAP